MFKLENLINNEKLGPIAVIAGVVGAGASAYGAYSSAKAQNQSIAAQNAYNMQQAKIDGQWYNMRLEYSKELEAYSNKKLEFAYEQEAYGYKKWQVSLENMYTQKQYEVEALGLKKQGALTQYNAQLDVTRIMEIGAREQAKNAVSETLRVGKANAKEANLKLQQAEGTINALLMSGLAGGDAAQRAAVAAFMERNNAVSQIDDKSKRSIIQIAAQRDKVNNDMALKVGESYRQLQAVMALQVSPIQQIMEPAPIFKEKEPLGPVQPAGATPAAVPQLSSGAMMSNALSSGMSGFTQGYNLGTGLGNMNWNWFSPSGSLGVTYEQGIYASNLGLA